VSTEAPAREATVRLRSPHASYWLSIETNQDTYNEFGGMRMVKAGEKIRFNRGIADIPASMVETVKANRFYGIDFWLEDEIKRPLEQIGGPRVASGQVHAASRQAAAEPLPGWRQEGPRELRRKIEAGMVADPEAALLYEAQNQKRSQVMSALARQIGGDDEPEPEAPVAEAGPIAPVPDTAKVD
jgi:hypothetical protein